MNIYTTRSLKRDETAGYIPLVHATGEGDPDTFVRDAEDDALDSAGFQMDMDTYVGNPIDDFFRLMYCFTLPTAGAYPKSEAVLSS